MAKIFAFIETVALHVMDKALLLCLNDGPLTGVVIAKRLGISRSAVWKRIEALRQQGVDIKALHGMGYALAEKMDFLQHDLILAELSQDTKQQLGQLQLADQVDSTNSWAQQTPLIRSDVADVFLAERQSAGRGRRGRAWASPYASNIYLSIHRRFDIGLSSLGGLSLLVGLVIAKTLRAMGFDSLGVKWPNDLWVGKKKCGGILMEVTGDSQGPVAVVIGIGLNVRMPAAAAEGIDQAWTDLQSLLPSEFISRNALVAALLNALLPVLKQFETQGVANALLQWPEYDVLLNQAVRIIAGEHEHLGVVLGVTEQGALRLQQENGIEKHYHSGEVSVRNL